MAENSAGINGKGECGFTMLVKVTGYERESSVFLMLMQDMVVQGPMNTLFTNENNPPMTPTKGNN